VFQRTAAAGARAAMSVSDEIGRRAAQAAGQA